MPPSGLTLRKRPDKPSRISSTSTATDRSPLSPARPDRLLRTASAVGGGPFKMRVCRKDPPSTDPSPTRADTSSGRRLLAVERPPTAIFTTSDLQAFGVLRAIGEAGLSVPEDIAVISFDGTIGTNYTWPPLTVAQQPIARMAHAAVETVRRESGAEPIHQAFAMELVVRRSCGCGPDESSGQSP
jgi:DNA-binding LacI/PurR family transcriptional regulator